MDRPVRLAVIGAGLIAQRAHLPAYAASSDVEIAGIAGGRPGVTREVAGRFAVPHVYASWEEAVADPTVDAIDICAPNNLHAPIGVAAARAGKHVLVEKPMAVTLAEADAMIDAADRAGVVLMVAHNLRYVPIYEQVKRIIALGTIGRPLTARGVFMHAGPDEFWGAAGEWFWRKETAGGGSLLDMGIHMIDLVRWFMGEPVAAVNAMTSRMIKPTFADDNAMLLMRFRGGALASVQSSWTARPFPDRQVTIHGELGHVAMGRSAGEPLAVHVKDGDGHRTIVPEIPAVSALGNPFAHFIDVIRTGAASLTGGREGRESLAVALAAYEAASTGCLVRPVPAVKKR